MSKASVLCRLRHVVCPLLAGLLVSGLFINADATIMRYLEVEELARLSTAIIHGQVVSTKTYWNEDHTRIYTAVRVQINESFKGAAKRGETVTVTQLGGELDGMRLDYSGRPVFTTGETVVLFTKPGQNHDLIVVGMKQGKLRVNGDEVVRDFSGITLVTETVQTKTNGRVAAVSKPVQAQTRLTLSELRQRLAKL